MWSTMNWKEANSIFLIHTLNCLDNVGMIFDIAIGGFPSSSPTTIFLSVETVQNIGLAPTFDTSLISL